MKVFAEADRDDFAIKRVANAVKKYSPKKIEFVEKGEKIRYRSTLYSKHPKPSNDRLEFDLGIGKSCLELLRSEKTL